MSPEDFKRTVADISDWLDETRLTPEARDLLTIEGQLNALTELYLQLKDADLSRDQVSALTSARRCLSEIADIFQNLIANQLDAEGQKKLDEYNRQLDQRGGASGTAFDGYSPKAKPASGGN